jgi:hypothetical protein
MGYGGDNVGLRTAFCESIHHTWLSARLLSASLAGMAVLALGVGAVPAQAEPTPNGVPGNWALILNEEFGADGLNTALWTPEWPAGAMSGQCTSPGLVSQPGNGYLYLEVRGQESTCSRIKNADTGSLVESNPADGKPGHSGFLYSYGYVEWHVYVVGWGGEEQGCPKGGCVPDWPALWSFPENEENEIDTMEGLHGKICHTWHHHVSPIEETQGCQSGSYAGWHTYGADWEPGVLKFYYDGTQVGEVNTGYINSTPQYLIMDDVPPGSYGGKLVVPDEIVVDYVRVWQHLPIVTTDAATGKQPLQATLNGTVSPNGLPLTSCRFEYGTSILYGSSAPCSGPESGESATVSLAPDTTYHFRIVATNVSGTTYGNDETFTTPGPVEAVTGTASEVEQFQVTLNGSVNPRGYDAKYYFEYGLTTKYGSTTMPEGDAGSGAGAIPESAPIVGLKPLTVYYYRLVATGGGITSYGSNQAVTTSPDPRASTVLMSDGESAVFFRGTNGLIDELVYNGTWHSYGIGGSPAPNAVPAVASRSNGDVEVYFRSTSGDIEELLYNGTWHSYGIGGSPTSAEGDPTVASQSNGDVEVYFRSTSGDIEELLYNGTWHSYGIGGTPSGDPTVASPSEGNLVYFRSTNGDIEELLYNGTWHAYGLGGSPSPGAVPAAIVQSGGNQQIYFPSTNGDIEELLYNGTWHAYGLGGSPEPNAGNSTVATQSNGDVEVYFLSTNGDIEELFYNGLWNAYGIGGSPVGEPVVAALSEGNILYFPSANGDIEQLAYTGGDWHAYGLGGEPG